MLSLAHDVPSEETYIMNVWVSENHICVAQEQIDDKSNGIAAILVALEGIDIEEAVVSIDTMATLRDIADLIVQKKEHYLLALKKDQFSLYEDVESAFKTHIGYDRSKSVEADHGRIETCCFISLPIFSLLTWMYRWLVFLFLCPIIRLTLSMSAPLKRKYTVQHGM